MSELKLWEHQKLGLDWIMSKPHSALDYTMGSGKTLCAIMSIIARKDANKILIVTPKSVIKTWRTEINTFVEPGVFNIVDFTEKKNLSTKVKAEKIKQIKMKLKTVIVVNYDIVWREPLISVLAQWHADYIILDESHRIKSPGSKVSLGLRTLGKNTKYKLCLSGTMIANSPLDIYAQFRFLDTKVFGTSFVNFRSRYFQMISLNPPITGKPINTDELMGKFHKLALTCAQKDLDIGLKGHLPDIVRTTRLDLKSQAAHDELTKEFITTLEDGETLVVSNTLTKILRSLEMTSGYTKVEGQMIHMNDVKIELLKEVLEDLEPQPLVIFYQFKEDVKRIKTAIKGVKIFELSGRVNELADWKATEDSENAIIAVQMQSGNSGIDLVKARTSIYYSRNHSLSMYEQSRARTERPGQKYVCRFVHLIVENSIDEFGYKALKDKKNLLDLIKTGNYK